MRSVQTSLVSGLVVTALTACGSADDATKRAETGTSADELSAQDFDTAAKALSSLPYLPWGFTEDGCYARALYYSMKLASIGIPSKHLYAFAQEGEALYGIWGWHVAPVATREGQNQLYVFDPALSPNKVVTAAEWIAIQGYSNPSSRSYPELDVASGTSYLDTNGAITVTNPRAPSASVYGEPTFAAMPRFSVGNVNAACDVMHAYIDYEPGSSSQSRFTKHEGLATATVALVNELVRRGKMIGTTSQIDDSCLDPPQTDTSGCNLDSTTAKPTRAACCIASPHWCWHDGANGGRGGCYAEGTRAGDTVCRAHQWQSEP